MHIPRTRARIWGSLTGLTLAATMLTAVPLNAHAEAPAGTVPVGAWVDEFDSSTLDSAWTITKGAEANNYFAAADWLVVG